MATEVTTSRLFAKNSSSPSGYTLIANIYAAWAIAETETDYTVSISRFWHYASHFNHSTSSSVDVGTNYSVTVSFTVDGATVATSTFSGKHKSYDTTAYVYQRDFTYSEWKPSKTLSKTHSNDSHTIGITGTYTYNGQTYQLDATQASDGRDPVSNLLTFTVPAKPSYAVTFNANGGTGAPSSQQKWYNETLTISSSTPTRAGYAFVRWNTAADGSGTAYGPGATYTTNAALSLFAVWSDAPTISSLTVVRCDLSGTQDDQGTYCKVTAVWSVDRSKVSNNTGSVSGSVGSRSITWDSGSSGAGGTAVAVVSNIDTDTQYTVTVTVTDSLVSATSRSDILTRAKFVWDIRAGGLAMGIGSAAPQSGLEVGWVAQFDENVTLLRNLILNGTISGTQFDLVSATSGIVTAETGWAVSSQGAKVVGRVCMIQLAFKPSASVSANTSSTIGTIASDYRPLLRQGFADSSGTGYVSTGGSITFRNLTALTTSSTIYVALTYIK